MAKVKVEFDLVEATSVSCAIGRCMRDLERRMNLDCADKVILDGCKSAYRTLGKEIEKGIKEGW